MRALKILLRAAALAALLCALVAAQGLPVVLDTDIGDDIDDALALALALQSPELDVRAVTTVLGDGKHRADLVEHILELYGRTEIPVGIGAETPLLAPTRPGPLRQAAALPANYRPAAHYASGLPLLIDTCLRAPRKITIVAYGPLTNIGIALRAEPRLRDHVERIVLMNGVFFHAGLEYNTKMDPEAAHIVYSSGIPVSTVGLDVTLQCHLNAASLKSFQESQVPGVQFLWKLIQIWQDGHADQYPILHDPLSIVSVVRPSLMGFARGDVYVETNGTPEQTYGMSVFHANAAGTVNVAETVNAPSVVDFFLSRVLAPPRKR